MDWSRNTRNEALFPLGEWDECLKVAEDLIAEDAKRGGSQVGTFAKAWAALLRIFRGETTEPLAMLEEALESAREIEDPQALMPCLAILTRGADMSGDSARAKTLATEFLELAPHHPTFLAGLFSYVAPTMRRLDMASELAALIKAAKPIGPGPTADVDLARAALAEARGNLREALDLLTSVIEANDGMSNKFVGTLARIEAARVAGLLEHDDEQARLLDEAESLAQMMGAGRFLDQIAEMRADGKEAAAAGS